MRYQGKISTWKDDKGFGFITPNGGGNQVFAHIKSFTNRQRRPVGNEIVTYELLTDTNGRSKAENVAFVGERVQQHSSFEHGKLSMMFSAIFLIFVAGAAFFGKLPLAVLALYLFASVAVFFIYMLDKSAAKLDQWRIQENTLHFFAFIGGWPGALAAQSILRHKTKKVTFQVMFWITVLLNCGILGWLFTSDGSKLLRSILASA